MTEPTIEYQTAAEPTAITEYRPTAAALAHLRAKYAAPFDATTTAGLAAAKAARAEIRDLRGKLEKTRAEIKAPVLAQGKLIDDEAKRINAELLAIEEPIDAAIKAEERRKAEEKAERERAEAARKLALQAQIDAIRRRVLAVANRDAAAIRSAQREELARRQAELDRQQAAEDAQRQAEQEELAGLRAAEEARRQQEIKAKDRAGRERQEAEAKARAEAEAARKPAEATAKTAKARKPAKADPLAEIKDALAAGTLTGPEAIDRAYQLGFEAGEQAMRQAA